MTLDLLAKAFREAANDYLPTLQRPMTQQGSALNAFHVADPERDRQEKIVHAVMCAIAHALEKAAKEEAPE